MGLMVKEMKHPDCPTDDFTNGEPNGKCWGDGHYMCNDCKHFRPDFKGDGWMKKNLV